MAQSTASSPSAKGWPWRTYFLVALALTLATDLATKWWIFRDLDTTHPAWLAMAQLRYAEVSWIVPQVNSGAAWSIGSDQPLVIFILTVILVPLLIGYYWWAIRRSPRLLEHLGFAMIIGGALGNAWDRLLAMLPGGGYGGVRDFIHCDLAVVGIPYIWPTFNIADSGITVGLGLVIIAALFSASGPCKNPESKEGR